MDRRKPYKALQCLCDGQLMNYALPDRTDSIWGIAQDTSGDIWAGGTGSCLVRITKDNELVDETARTGMVPRAIRSLYATLDGALWICYDQGGVGRIKDSTFCRITTNEGLVNDNLRAVISDGEGWMWFVAVTAVFKVRESELADVAEGRATRVQPVRYGRDQGLHVVLGGTVGALVSHDGRLWLPLATNLAIIRPERQKQHPAPPPVSIEQILVDDRVVASDAASLPTPEGLPLESAALRLDPDHRRIDIECSALSFTAPGNIRYRYRMSPIDKDWSNPRTERRATYSRLPAGKYEFHMQACNGDGVWNETGATLAFTVDPFWWNTWWFRTAVVLVFTGAIFGTARYISVRRLQRRLRRAEQETAVERERARIARDIHDDFGGRLTRIVLLSSLVARDQTSPETNGQRVQEISDTARQLMKSLDETVWMVNPRNDNLPHLVSYVGEYAMKFLRTAEIDCELDLPDDPPQLPVRADVRHHLLLTIKEALTNIVRHAQATHVILRVAVAAGLLTIEVDDDGRGFTTGKSEPGADGLNNMRQRMEQIDGRLALKSQPGTGTKLSLSLPLPVGN